MCTKSRIFLLIFSVFIVLPLAGCLDQKIKDDAKRLRWRINKVDELNKSDLEVFQNQIKRSAFGNKTAIIVSNDLEKYYKIEREQIDALIDEYRTEIQPILKKDDEIDNEKLKTLTLKLSAKLKVITPARKIIDKKLVLFHRYKTDRANFFKQLSSEIDEMSASLGKIRKALSEVENISPESLEEINAQIEEAVLLLTSCVALYKNIVDSDDTGTVINAHETILKKKEEFNSIIQKVNPKIEHLNHSVSKVVMDFKKVHIAEIVRVGWDSGSDGDTEHTYLYSPFEVSEETYNYLHTLSPDKQIAKCSNNSFSSGYTTKAYIDQKVWQSIHICVREKWPIQPNDHKKLSKYGINVSDSYFISTDEEYQIKDKMEQIGLEWPQHGGSHNVAGYWIQELYIQLYVKILTIIDGKEEKTEWVAYDDDEKGEYEAFLGMAIYSKPAGFTSNQAHTEAMPPGMDLVGNTKTGEWKRDSSGDEFWGFYGRYHFYSNLLGDPIYRSNRNDWYKNYRGNEPYFGSNADKTQRWGTGGSVVRTNSVYVSSNYAKTGNLKTPVASARGKGATMRNRGPGGKGK